MSIYIGLDVGTSGTKVLAVSPDGAVVALAGREYPLSTPKNGWAEQDPALWANAAIECLREIVSKTEGEHIGGIGLTGQMHGLTALDTAGNILRPALLWCDQRTGAECDEINEKIGKARLIELTANPALTGFTAPKILWVRNNEPGIYAKISHILLPKDYIRYYLSGEFAADLSDASGMGILDVSHREWSGEVLEKLEIERAWLPSLHESVEITARTSKKAQELTGIPAGTPIVAGAGDNAAAAIGTGICRDGEAFITIGSSGVVFAHSSKMITEPYGRVHSFCSAVPHEWHTMGVTLAAGLSMEWYRKTMCSELSFDEINIIAERSEIGANGVFFLPYLNGERTPHLDPDVRGAFLGLSSSHTRGDLARSVFEGVTYSLRDCYEIISGMGTKFEAITACGGGSKSTFWRQMIADALNVPVDTAQTSDAPALGAAILAMAADNQFSSVIEACNAIIKKSTPVTPKPEAHEKYTKAYKKYKSLYPIVSQLS